MLGLYGQLAAEMTPGTFVSGESVAIAPLAGDHYRSTYLPPNGASNAAFLETLRLMVVHETIGSTGAPRGLELAYSTPRTWLAPGKRIEVTRLPTSFGRVSFTIEAGSGSAHVSLEVPDRVPLKYASTQAAAPGRQAGRRGAARRRPLRRVLPDGETIVLPARSGLLELEARFS